MLAIIPDSQCVPARQLEGGGCGRGGSSLGSCDGRLGEESAVTALGESPGCVFGKGCVVFRCGDSSHVCESQTYLLLLPSLHSLSREQQPAY